DSGRRRSRPHHLHVEAPARQARGDRSRPAEAGPDGGRQLAAVVNLRHSILAVTVAAAVLLVMSRPPMPQALDYHRMADERALLGLPNALNVLSNVPFA